MLHMVALLLHVQQVAELSCTQINFADVIVVDMLIEALLVAPHLHNIVAVTVKLAQLW